MYQTNVEVLAFWTRFDGWPDWTAQAEVCAGLHGNEEVMSSGLR